MCGACGRRAARDSWSSVLDFRRARWEVAQIVNSLLVEASHPARVSATAGSWVVRSGTGRDVVVDTLTELWEAVRAVRQVSVRPAAREQSPHLSAVEHAVVTAGRLKDRPC